MTTMDTPTQQHVATAPDTRTAWTIDPVHSTIGFSIKHMAVATVRGRFGGFRGTFRFDEDRPQDASVEVEIVPPMGDSLQLQTEVQNADGLEMGQVQVQLLVIPAVAGEHEVLAWLVDEAEHRSEEAIATFTAE